MTKPTNRPLYAPEPPDHSYVLKRLVASVVANTGKLDLLMALCDSLQTRQQLIDAYEATLEAKGFECSRIDMLSPSPERPYSLRQRLERWQQQRLEAPPAGAAKAVITVLNLEQLKETELKLFYFSVQWTRESLRHIPVPVVLWVTTAIAQNIAEKAPDFWSWRGGTFEF